MDERPGVGPGVLVWVAVSVALWVIIVLAFIQCSGGSN
jgi:hypothetical protein